ncbi:stage II sporulation protein P [Orenia marismortui]|uniref:Stage II sporulation protein P n=1 Tax=Orenia marismortui TaxID=46469 RepID=A0A4R8GXV7_9FIRM|nr:stage II sporulation protein P [Orenia marismortui]TDX51079.1 stage II sporulation protein P [Orenia marismortui]
MFRDQHRFLNVIIILYIILLLFLGGLIFQKYNFSSNLLVGDIFFNNKLVHYIINFIYLDEIDSKILLKQGLPIVRVNNSQLSNKSNFLNLTCSFITDLPLSFFKAKEDNRVKMVINQVTKKYNQTVEDKLRAEGTHENEERVKIELNFWQTEPSNEIEDPQGQINNDIYNKSNPQDIFPKRDKANLKKALVGIYHTHTAENYENRGYNSRAGSGNRGDVVLVGNELSKVLKEKYNILSVHSKRVNDKTYGKSYINSLKTVESIVKNNSELQMVFDIHRDAIGHGSKDLITTTINGQKVARIMIIVTNNQYGLPHPNWKENFKFAKRLAQKMNAMYPGLLRDVKLLSNRRYNQHVHNHALLLEVGGAKNTIEEAKRSADLLADVLASLIREGV